MEKTVKVRKYVLRVLTGGMAISVLASIVMLVIGIFTPAVLRFAQWIALPTPLLCVVFMIYSKEVIMHREYWKVLHPAVRVGWWVILIFNMYMFVDTLFEVL